MGDKKDRCGGAELFSISKRGRDQGAAYHLAEELTCKGTSLDLKEATLPVYARGWVVGRTRPFPCGKTSLVSGLRDGAGENQ